MTLAPLFLTIALAGGALAGPEDFGLPSPKSGLEAAKAAAKQGPPVADKDAASPAPPSLQAGDVTLVIDPKVSREHGALLQAALKASAAEFEGLLKRSEEWVPNWFRYWQPTAVSETAVRGAHGEPLLRFRIEVYNRRGPIPFRVIYAVLDPATGGLVELRFAGTSLSEHGMPA